MLILAAVVDWSGKGVPLPKSTANVNSLLKNSSPFLAFIVIETRTRLLYNKKAER